MTDIAARAREAYEQGMPPLDYAEVKVLSLLAVHLAVLDVAEDLGLAGMAASDGLTLIALARRVIGELMDAGWVMPVWPVPEPGPRKETP